MREVTLEQLIELIQRVPVMADMHPLSVLFLPDEAICFESLSEMIAQLDSPHPQPAVPMLALACDSNYAHRFPAVRCTHNPLTGALNSVLLKRYDDIRNRLVLQSQLAHHIVAQADAEAIVLLMIDGLSYDEVARFAPHWLEYTTPVLVDGISITEHGMKRIVGDPPLAQRLFDIGYANLYGFTYWERDQEALTDVLFRGFGNRVKKVREFRAVLDEIKTIAKERTFIQIVRTGLDQLAHQHRDRPNLESAVRTLFMDLEELIDGFQQACCSAQVHLVSDHGMLWTWEHSLKPYEPSGDQPRYYEYPKVSQHTRIFEFEGREYSALEYPYLRRSLRSTEWGVHGGLSFQESLIPWIHYRTEL